MCCVTENAVAPTPSEVMAVQTPILWEFPPLQTVAVGGISFDVVYDDLMVGVGIIKHIVARRRIINEKSFILFTNYFETNKVTVSNSTGNAITLSTNFSESGLARYCL